ncbi:SMI1/KNR4 family protein, partial [Salmonella enterica]
CYTEGKEIKKTKYVFSEYVLAEIELYNRYQ